METQEETRSARGRFGLSWMHWLSLDAVAVLVAYSWALGRIGGAPPPARVHWLLGGGIWLGYAADRLADVRRDPVAAEKRPCHAFHLRHFRALRLVWWGVCLGLIALGAWTLPREAFVLGAAVALGAFGYVRWFASRGRPAGKGARWFPFFKRTATVVLLTLAGAWWAPWWGVRERPALVAGLVLFALTAGWELWLVHHRGRRLPWAGELLFGAIALFAAWHAGDVEALPGLAVMLGGLVFVAGRKSGMDSSARIARADLCLACGWILLAGLVR